VRNTLRRHTGIDTDYAEELTQSAWVRAWEKRKQFRGTNGCKFKTWVTRIALNLLRQNQRRDWRREDLLPEMEQALVIESRTEHDTIAIELITRCCTRRQQHFIDLAYFGGFSYPEIAKRTGTTALVVKAAVNYARHLMRTGTPAANRHKGRRKGRPNQPQPKMHKVAA
jgi:RNA polymerase sigma-70 factor (ECF subfamily)